MKQRALIKQARPGLLARARARLAAFADSRTERQTLGCRCAVRDRVFVAVFARKRGGGFTLEDIRVQQADDSLPESGTTIRTSFAARLFNLSAITCPCCGQRRFTLCGACGAYVCNGRSGGRDGAAYFRCAPSCGNEGSVGELKRIEAARPAGPPRLAAPASRLRLPKPKP